MFTQSFRMKGNLVPMKRRFRETQKTQLMCCEMRYINLALKMLTPFVACWLFAIDGSMLES
jgi:hypothetical protein